MQWGVVAIGVAVGGSSSGIGSSGSRGTVGAGAAAILGRGTVGGSVQVLKLGRGLAPPPPSSSSSLECLWSDSWKVRRQEKEEEEGA